MSGLHHISEHALEDGYFTDCSTCSSRSESDGLGDVGPDDVGPDDQEDFENAIDDDSDSDAQSVASDHDSVVSEDLGSVPDSTRSVSRLFTASLPAPSPPARAPSPLYPAADPRSVPFPPDAGMRLARHEPDDVPRTRSFNVLFPHEDEARFRLCPEVEGTGLIALYPVVDDVQHVPLAFYNNMPPLPWVPYFSTGGLSDDNADCATIGTLPKRMPALPLRRSCWWPRNVDFADAFGYTSEDGEAEVDAAGPAGNPSASPTPIPDAHDDNATPTPDEHNDEDATRTPTPENVRDNNEDFGFVEPLFPLDPAWTKRRWLARDRRGTRPWPPEKVQQCAAALMRLFLGSPAAVQRPQRWMDLYQYFDEVDLFVLGVGNLQRVLWYLADVAATPAAVRAEDDRLRMWAWQYACSEPGRQLLAWNKKRTFFTWDRQGDVLDAIPTLEAEVGPLTERGRMQVRHVLVQAAPSFGRRRLVH